MNTEQDAAKRDDLNLFSVNSDFTGSREITKSRENVNFHKKSTLRIWYNTQPDGFETHWHNAMEIIVPIENHYDATVRGDSFHLLPGDVLIIPPRELHGLSSPDHGSRFIYLFDLTPIAGMKDFIRLKPALSRPILLNDKDAPEIYRLLMQMRDEYFAAEDFSELTIYSHLLQLLAKLGAHFLCAADCFPHSSHPKQQQYIHMFNDVMNYINSHCTEEMNLEDIAQSAGFSKFHFSRLFKQYTDLNFSHYVNYQRIKTAEELLADPTLSITDVAMRSGFSSVSTFNRLFREQNRCTPTEFRSKQQTLRSF